MAQPLPVVPRGASIATRIATMADLPFLDGLQKQNSKALGFFPRAQMEGYVANQWVLIAEENRGSGIGCRVSGEDKEDAVSSTPNPETRTPRRRTGMAGQPEPVGYCISRDRYLKRDELGVVYQLCVAPGHQRGLIGAALVRDVFARSAYGCKLYCCWCAQDLAANHFWESMGFVPIAFRAGSTGKRRVHIFWQRRVDRVSGVGYRVWGEDSSDASSRNPNPDTRTPTPYWYPCQTNSGAIREDRLVFPIPPGTHWSAVEAVAMPAPERTGNQLPSPERETTVKRNRADDARADSAAIPQPATISTGGLFFAPPAPPKPQKARRARPQKVKEKIDPQRVAKARELRDRWMEHANDRLLFAPRGKYEVSRPVGMNAPAPLPALPSPAAA